MSDTAPREPNPASPGLAVGIDEALVREVVETFYAKVRRDPLLGPIFNEAVADWPDHLDRLCAFWSSLTLMTGRYKGDPFGVHLKLPPLGPIHFRTWLGLFEETIGQLCAPDQAEVFRTRAERVAESLNLGLAIRRGEASLPARRSRSPTSLPVQPASNRRSTNSSRS
jgi:hemoglobin